MARSSRAPARRRTTAGNGRATEDHALPAAAASSADDAGVDGAMQLGMQWARDAASASLSGAQGWFEWLQAVQQLQAQSLHSVAADVQQALAAIESAHDAAALAAVPGRLLSAQWQHSMENASQAAGRLLELEAAWMQQVQSQAQRQFAAWEPVAAAASNGRLSAARAHVADEADDDDPAHALQQWGQQWAERWQAGVGEMSRAWNDALQNAAAQAQSAQR